VFLEAANQWAVEGTMLQRS